MSPHRKVVLCADDYGLSPGVNRAILQLAEAGRISATSCLTNVPGWFEAARSLRALDRQVGIGLHLNLTEGRPVGPMPSLAPDGTLPPLRSLLASALSGRLRPAEIGSEIANQLAAFGDAVGRAPDFVDGHQHVHVLPGVRGPLLEALAKAGLAGRLWLRDPSEDVAAIFARRLAAPKALFVASLAAGFARTARTNAFRTNRGFSGFSSFDAARDPALDMQLFLDRMGSAPLVMCHPGEPEPGSDPIGPARAREHAYLASSAFPALLAERRIELVREPAAV